jgi:hypothetical protein
MVGGAYTGTACNGVQESVTASVQSQYNALLDLGGTAGSIGWRVGQVIGAVGIPGAGGVSRAAATARAAAEAAARRTATQAADRIAANAGTPLEIQIGSKIETQMGEARLDPRVCASSHQQPERDCPDPRHTMVARRRTERRPSNGLHQPLGRIRRS